MTIEISTANALMTFCLGAILTIGIYWRRGISDARYRFLCELKILRHRVWWEIKDDNILAVWNESLIPLWRSYFEYYRWLRFCWKSRADEAWREYKGTNKEMVATIPDSKCPPYNRKELLDKIDALISAID